MQVILTNFEDVSYHYLDGSSNVSILNKANYSFEKEKSMQLLALAVMGRQQLYIGWCFR